MAEYDITSASNERIKWLVRLRDRKHRDAEGVFVVEGERALERALESGLEPLEVYHDPARINASGLAALSVAPEVLNKASYRSESEGILAVFRQQDVELDSIPVTRRGFYLMAEGIEKPGNLGAMLRTADAVGANGFVSIDSTVDLFNPNCVRASTGALFSVAMASAGLENTIRWLRQNEIGLVAADPHAEDDYWSANLKGPVALVVGSEATGLSEAALTAADVSVSIPMTGASDSLNSAVSLSVIAYEAIRQRKT